MSASDGVVVLTINASRRQPWVTAVGLAGAAYLVAGVGFAALAGAAESDQARRLWRLAAWITSAAVYAAHIGYEHLKQGSSRRAVALRAALAVGLGALGLAAAATVRGALAQAPNQLGRLLSLVIWPLLTALPAYLVALLAATLLVRASRRA